MIAAIITLISKNLLIGNFLGGIVEVFLYSILHAYYCYEYKTALMDLDLLSSIAYFEAQWAYYCGFGFLFTMVLYLCKEVGSSLFFLFFPLMIVISLDENGQGLLPFRVERDCPFTIPLFTLANYPYTWLMRKFNKYVESE